MNTPFFATRFARHIFRSSQVLDYLLTEMEAGAWAANVLAPFGKNR